LEGRRSAPPAHGDPVRPLREPEDAHRSSERPDDLQVIPCIGHDGDAGIVVGVDVPHAEFAAEAGNHRRTGSVIHRAANLGGAHAATQALSIAPAVEREVRALVPEWPMFQFRTMNEGLELQKLVPGLGATVLGTLGLFGLLLAAVGVYGVMAFVVRQRTHEIGIRLALGAQTANVMILVIRQGMAVCITGAVVGLGLGLAAARLLASVLYGISATDPITFLVVPGVLLTIALLACFIPARRITSVSAVEALRHE